MSFVLARASLKDVSAMAGISGKAFEKDRHTQLKALSQKPNEFEDGMASALEQWIKSERSVALNAIHPADGIIGWICWGFRGLPPPENDPAGEKLPDARVSQTTVERSKEKLVEGKQPIGQTEIANLSKLTNDDMMRWIKKIMPIGVNCMYIISLVVHPKYQGCGVGSKLIEWGTNFADDNGVFCWVHSSEAGVKTFAKNGFNEAEKLTVNLDEYAAEQICADSPNGKWGYYTWRYMIRPEKSSSNKP